MCKRQHHDVTSSCVSVPWWTISDRGVLSLSHYHSLVDLANRPNTRIYIIDQILDICICLLLYNLIQHCLIHYLMWYNSVLVIVFVFFLWSYKHEMFNRSLYASDRQKKTFKKTKGEKMCSVSCDRYSSSVCMLAYCVCWENGRKTHFYTLTV